MGGRDSISAPAAAIATRSPQRLLRRGEVDRRPETLDHGPVLEVDVKATSPELFSPSAQTPMLVLMILARSSLSALVMMASFFGFGPVNTPSVVKSVSSPSNAT